MEFPTYQDPDEDEPVDMDKIVAARKFMMDEVRLRASQGDALCGGLLAIESEFADHMFLEEYDSDLSDLDCMGPF